MSWRRRMSKTCNNVHYLATRYPKTFAYLSKSMATHAVLMASLASLAWLASGAYPKKILSNEMLNVTVYLPSTMGYYNSTRFAAQLLVCHTAWFIKLRLHCKLFVVTLKRLFCFPMWKRSETFQGLGKHDWRGEDGQKRILQ